MLGCIHIVAPLACCTMCPGVDIWKLGERFSSQNVHEFPEADKVGRDRWGVIPRAMQEIFRYATSSPDGTVKIWCTYLEIYNEHVRDLLRVGCASSYADGIGDLDIREDKVALLVRPLVNLSQDITQLPCKL